MNTLVKSILENSTTDTVFKPFPLGNRFNIKTGIWLHDSVPENLVVKEEFNLDFWNEISGWFHSNVTIGHPVYDARKDSSFEIPEDIQPKEPVGIGSWECHVVGDRIITPDYKVYKVYGFVNSSGGSNIYFNIK
jgi:hypothetical protein